MDLSSPLFPVPRHIRLRTSRTGADVGLSGAAGGKGERSTEEGGLGLAYLFHGLEEGCHEGLAPTQGPCHYEQTECVS